MRDSIPIAAVIGILLVLVGMAVVIARGDTTQQVAAVAEEARRVDALIIAATGLAGEVREALIIAQTATQGLVDPSQAASAADRIHTAIAGLQQAVEGLHADPDLVIAANPVIEEAAALATAVMRGASTDAVQIAETELGPSLDLLLRLGEERSLEKSTHIDGVSQGFGTVATAARYVTALLIPAVALFLLYRAVRRSQRLSLLRSELARERDLRRKKDAFLEAASHHIRTPLTAVVGFAELLRDRSRDFNAGVRQEITELMAIEAAETAAVVDDLLVAARYDLEDLESHDEPTDIRDLIDGVTRDWATRERMRLTVRGASTTSTDPRLLSHAIRNLLKNSTTFGGDHIRVEIMEVDRGVVIEVADDGKPLPAGEEERIFGLYYSYTPDSALAPSLGLGLPVARRIAKTLGGDLRYDRLEPENVFELSIPRTGTPSARTPIPDRRVDPFEDRPNLDAIMSIIADGGPDVAFQPIVELRTKEVVGYEALSRFGVGSPVPWFKTAAILGLSLELELSCIKAALGTFDFAASHRFLTVNLSDRTLHSSLLLDLLEDVEPGRLVLELSETATIKSYEATKGVVGALTARGIGLAIDDVGAGEVDLWHLARIGARLFKIDMSVVSRMGSSASDRALTRAIQAMALEMGVNVVAEGVESDDQHRLLNELEIALGQGYLYGKPEPWDRWARDENRSPRCG
ncbi:MAG: EAL domain-containing protein [Actinobacteria bacterium]|nr:EAL domain-containing protein [Actinomycetota bacterium]